MATLEKFQSDVLLGDVASSDLGYNFTEGTVTVQDGMKMGAIVELVAGKYVWVATGQEANAVGVVIDRDIEGYEGEDLAAGDHTLVVATRGCTFNKSKLTVAAGADADAAIAALEAAGANKVTDKVVEA